MHFRKRIAVTLVLTATVLVVTIKRPHGAGLSMSESKDKSSTENTLITYCDRCGERFTKKKSDDVGGLCEDCKSGHNKPRYRAADSTQIPYVVAPTDSEVMRSVRDNVKNP